VRAVARSLSLCCLAAAGLLAGELRAATVVLHNGDRLTGTVTGYAEGTLTLETEYSPPIRINTAKIREVTSDEPVTVVLIGGPTIEGLLRTMADGRLAVARPEGGTELFTWSGVQAINPKDGTWKGSVTLGANLQTGNTDRLNSSFEGRATRRTEENRLNLHLLFNYAEENGAATAQNVYWESKYDHFFSDRFYSFLNLNLFSDKFRDLRLRTVVGPGAGFQVWEDGRKSLLFEAGVAYFRENYEGGGEDDWVTGRLATEFGYRFNSTVRLTNHLVIHQRLDWLDDYHVRNETSLHSMLWSNWAIKFSNIFEYDSTPAEQAQATDIYWIVGLQYMF
jgi:putative salt-induced outer membrane protein YdiY